MAQRPTFNTAFGSLPTPRDQMGFSTGTGTAPGIDTWDALMQRQQARQRELQQQQYNAYMQQTGQPVQGPPPIAGWQSRPAPATPALPAQASDRAREAVAQAPVRQPAEERQAPSAPQPTFAEMQAQGRARPAPPRPAARPTPRLAPRPAQGEVSAQPAPAPAPEQLNARLMQQLGVQPVAPSPAATEDLLPQLQNVLGQTVAPLPAPTPVQEAPMAPPAPTEAPAAPAPAPAPAPMPMAAPAAMPAVEAPPAAAPLAEAPPAEAPIEAPAAMMEAVQAAADPDVVAEVATLLGVPADAITTAVQTMQAPAVTAAPAPSAPPVQEQVAQALGMAPTAVPAPVSTAAAPVAPITAPITALGGGAIGDLQQRLLQQLGALEQAPSRFESEAFQKARAAAVANLEAQYGAERSRLEEELARRGLSASSIAGGRYGDLAGQQARALATMEADLLKEAAMTEAQDKALLLQNYQQLLGTMSENERSELDRTLRRYEIDGTLRMRALELQQEAALRGRTMDIEEALGLARISVAREEMASRERISFAEMAQRGQQFAADLDFRRESLSAEQIYRMRQLGISEQDLAMRREQLKQQDAQFWASLTETQRNNLALEALRRDEMTQRGEQFGAELDLRRQQFTADQEYRMQQLSISRDELQIRKDQLANQDAQFWASLTETQRNNLALEQLSQERNTLSREELAQRQAQWQQEQTQRESINRINAIVQLSPFLADMTAEDAVRFFGSLGIPITPDVWRQVKSGATTGATGDYTGNYPSVGATGGYYPGTTLV